MLTRSPHQNASGPAIARKTARRPSSSRKVSSHLARAEDVTSDPAREERKTRTNRVHPKEADHRIEDLQPPSQTLTRSGDLDHKELAKSLGLRVTGAGKAAEVWYVGSAEKRRSEYLPYRLKDTLYSEEQPLEGWFDSGLNDTHEQAMEDLAWSPRLCKLT